MANLDANHYRKNSSTQYALAYEILNTIDFKGDETILDVGCGEGRITAELTKNVPRGNVVGIDPSSSMIDLALQSFPKKEIPNLDFKKISAEEMQFEQFADIILIMNTLHWVRDPWTALRKVASALKPGGILFILTYPKESHYWKFLEETVKDAEWTTYRELSASRTILFSHEYSRMLHEIGLTIDQCSMEEKIAIYPSSEELRDYIKGWLNCYLPIPYEHENAFLKKAISNASSFSLNFNNEEIHLPYSKLIIKARK